MGDPIDLALTEFAIGRERYLWNSLFDDIDRWRGATMNTFDTNIIVGYITTSDEPETFRLSGSAGGLRDFCDWMDSCLHDLSDMTGDEK